ncbi:unnamed protein product [Orchesella dallaii]|uniref:F-box domain-containing protein n=1 Tax=Orchesella dallaii TaxID=48710 RepID=A0ABP1RUW1_9HEXA
MENQGNPDRNEVETPPILRLLPEIWPEIFQHLNSSDFHSLINTSIVFRGEHKTEIINRLFPLILKIVLSQPTKSLDLNTWLALRQVNRSTKSAIDSLLCDESAPEAYWKRVTGRYYEWSTSGGDELHNLRSICKEVRSDYKISRQGKFFRLIINPKDFLCGSSLNSDKENRGKNPFLAKYFEIDCCAIADRQSQMRIEPLKNFMRQHGHNLTHLRFSSAHIMGLVFKLLPHAPNLKVLKLHTENPILNQNEYVKQIHYPDLPSLEFLDLDGFYDHDREQVNTRLNTALIRKYGLQIKTLSCGDQFFRGWWALGPFYRRKLSNLERIRVSKVTERTFIALSQENFAQLKELHFTNYDPSVGFNVQTVQQVVDTLNQFARSLTTVYLYLNLTDLRRGRDDVRKESLLVKLPKLKKLATFLDNTNATWFQQFLLLKCDSLEELHLHHRGRREGTLTNVRSKLKDFFGFARKLKRVRVTYLVNSRSQGSSERVDIYRDGVECRKLWSV